MERLLVTGVDGCLGINLALALAEHLDVLGLYQAHVVESPCLRTAAWQPHDELQIRELVLDWQPRWILHCGALSASSWDSPAEDDAAQREPRLVAQLAELSDELSARLTVISSDAVFTGPRMFHEETSIPTSATPHAQQVRAMEQALAATRALVLRTHAYGWSPVDGQMGFAERSLDVVAAGTLPPVDGLRHATPILATDLAAPLLRAYELRLQGLYHLSGAERTSPFRFVSEMAAAFGLHLPRRDTAKDHSSRDDGAAEAPHDCHGETSLNSKRARRALEMATPMLRDGLLRFAEQQHGGWRDRYQVLGPTPCRHQLAA